TDNEQVAFYKGRCAHPPTWGFRGVLFCELLLPDEISRDRVQAAKMTRGSQCVDLALVHGWGRSWAAPIADPAVAARVRVAPERLACFFSKAKNTLSFFRAGVPVGDITPTLRDDWS